MPESIFLDPSSAFADADVIKVGGQCYWNAGSCVVSPDTSIVVEHAYDSCDDCENPPLCGCDGLEHTYVVHIPAGRLYDITCNVVGSTSAKNYVDWDTQDVVVTFDGDCIWGPSTGSGTIRYNLYFGTYSSNTTCGGEPDGYSWKSPDEFNNVTVSLIGAGSPSCYWQINFQIHGVDTGEDGGPDGYNLFWNKVNPSVDTPVGSYSLITSPAPGGGNLSVS